ncbi:MAG: rSAM-partnered protein, Htur_1727 family [uncultured archaeon A07HR60]|nr:MAG: rSAM-partnered protein, Htur_1727 family [uncultured archaeon A07HR60]
MAEWSMRRGTDEGESNSTLSEWEVFVRPNETESLRHVGCVSAAAAETARQHASRLFGRQAEEMWLTPAARVHRHSSRSVADACQTRSSDSEGNTDEDGRLGPETEPDTGAEKETETQTQTHADPNPSPDSVVDGDTSPDTNGDGGSDSGAESHSDATPETHPDSDTQGGSTVDSGGKHTRGVGE